MEQLEREVVELLPILLAGDFLLDVVGPSEDLSLDSRSASGCGLEM